MNAYVNGFKISLDPKKSIGKGGEADVFDIGGGKVIKIFKLPDHPDYTGFPKEQKGAKFRIAEHQKKLRNFPNNLPAKIITPEEIATDASGKNIVGYTMKFLQGAYPILKLSDSTFRKAGIGNESVIKIYRDLYGTVAGIHPANVVIGDFNDLNVLIKGEEAYIIDSDSIQFGGFFCTVFTNSFVDPLLCDENLRELLLVRPHNVESDWYAFAVMLMQSLLFVGPYGGVYRPADKRKMIPHDMRPLKRITVFNPEVRYPKPATHYRILSDDLLHYFHQVFEKDMRGVFPMKLLDNLRWTKCLNCGTEHARSVCPDCAHAAPAAIKEVTVIRGKVASTRVFTTSGLIVFSDYQNGRLNWIYHENGEFKRENGKTVIKGDLDPRMRFRIRGKDTLIGMGNSFLTLTEEKEPLRNNVDSFGTLPIISANESHIYWLENGRLERDDYLGPKFIGNALANQTLFWTGSEFGFGFYRAGNMSVAFTFDVKEQGVNDSIKLPTIRGQLVDSTCVFSRDRAWFFIATKEGGKTINRCFVIKRDGQIEASAEAEQNDGSWLSDLRGKCAAGNFLLAATDEGVARLEIDSGRIVLAKEFPDTEPFVDSSCNLFAGSDGLYVVSGREIKLLKIS